jgi:uncharacterized protein (UPF0332 family)
MSCKPLDLLGLAKQLAALPNEASDVGTRCVISRAYYASLHEIDASFEKLDSTELQDGSSHQKIIDRAARHGKNLGLGQLEAGQIAKFATKLRRERNAADYELGLDITPSKASEVLISAERIFSLCAEVRNKRAKQQSE